ncbi:MAG: RNA methyltransferase [Myxococcota bacterium]
MAEDSQFDTLADSLSRVRIVLWEPQDDINIGNAVRACKNFGITDIRLVRPAEADPRRISISAPKARDVIEAMPHCESLEEALEGCAYVVGTTARPRAEARVVVEPRGAAARVIEKTEQGDCAYIFGREDWGLPNEVLDRCHAVVTIPTNPDYTSLNLGQAILLNVWEVFRVAQEVGVELPETGVKARESEHPPADMAVMERMFDQAERSLERIEFFKAETNDHIMSAVRSVMVRAELDERELAVWFGIFKEIETYLDRAVRDSE